VIESDAHPGNDAVASLDPVAHPATPPVPVNARDPIHPADNPVPKRWRERHLPRPSKNKVRSAIDQCASLARKDDPSADDRKLCRCLVYTAQVA
jgi:hypothetical protein